MSLPKPDCTVPAVRHLADDRDVVVDPDAARPDLAGGRAARGRRRWSRPRRPGRTACRWPAAGPRRRSRRAGRRAPGRRPRPARSRSPARRRRRASARSRQPAARSPAGVPDRRTTTLAPSSAAPARRSRRRAPAGARTPAGPGRSPGRGSGRGGPRRMTSATPVDEGVVERALDVGPGRGRAVLAGVDQRPGDRAVDGGLEVGVVVDDERRLAAELEVDPLRRARGHAA